MQDYGFGQLRGYQIEYTGIMIDDYYREGGTFIAVKLLQKAILEYSQTGKVTYSNDHLIETFEVSRRGLQIAMSILEKEGIMKRTFSDPDTKRHRTGFILDVDMAIVWLGCTTLSDEYKHAPRRSLFRAFVNQAVINIKSFAKELKKAIRITKNKEERKAREEQIQQLNKKQKDYDKHVSRLIKRRNRIANAAADTLMDLTEAIDTIKSWTKKLGYKPPELSKN